MAGKQWTPEEDKLIVEMDETLSTYELADRLPGRTRRAVLHRRKILGLPSRTAEENGKRQSSKWTADFEARLGESVSGWLRRRYIDEKATYRELTSEIGINTRTLMRLMKECNIDPIDKKESIKRQLEKDPELFNRLAANGSSERAARTRAIKRQANWGTFCTPYEHAFLSALTEAGLHPIPQLAVGTFNIDFAFPEVNLAVELDPRWHNSPKKRPLDAKKDAFLKSLGWTVLRIDSRTSHSHNIDKVSAALNALASIQPR